MAPPLSICQERDHILLTAAAKTKMPLISMLFPNPFQKDLYSWTMCAEDSAGRPKLTPNQIALMKSRINKSPIHE